MTATLAVVVAERFDDGIIEIAAVGEPPSLFWLAAYAGPTMAQRDTMKERFAKKCQRGVGVKLVRPKHHEKARNTQAHFQ